MKNKNPFYILIFFALVLCQGCSPVYYVPNQPNMPMFRKGGEGKASFNIASPFVGEIDNAFEGQLSASIINHLGVTANGFITSGNNNSSDNDVYKGQGRMWEAGIGYFNLVDDKWGFDVSAGAGKCTMNIFKDNKMYFEADINRWYLQPSFYYSGKHMEAGIAFRVCGVNYVNTRLGTEYPNNIDDALTTNSPLFYEPSVYFAFGGPLIKGHIQCTPSFYVGNARDFNREKLMISMGVDFIINRKYGLGK